LTENTQSAVQEWQGSVDRIVQTLLNTSATKAAIDETVERIEKRWGENAARWAQAKLAAKPVAEQTVIKASRQPVPKSMLPKAEPATPERRPPAVVVTPAITQPQAKEVKDEAVRALNQQHAIINNVGGKTVIASWEPSPVDPSRKEIIYHRQSDFMLRYGNRFVSVTVPDAHGGTKTLSQPLGKWWLGHRDRRQHAGVVFMPGIAPGGEVNDCLNLWRGWGVNPVPGDWSLIREHIEEVIAGGNPGAAEYVIRWIAWSIQNPAKPAEAALVLIGSKGTGKGTLGRALQRIFSQEHTYQASSSEDLVGRFSGHLQACILFIADEAQWGDRQKACVGRLQSMITEATLVIEPKGIERFQIRNMLHVIMLAEPGWVIPAGPHERRYAALEVSNIRQRDREYFKRLHHQIDNGGAEAMFAELGGVDLDGWHPREIPDEILRGAAIQKQQGHALPPMEQWYLTLLHDGKLPEALPKRLNTTFTQNLKKDAQEKFPRLRYDLSEVSLRNFLVDKDRIGVECEKFRSAIGNGWSFPPLDECREAWEAIYGPVAWESPGVEWGRKLSAEELLDVPLGSLGPSPKPRPAPPRIIDVTPTVIAPKPSADGGAPKMRRL
jgi:hypothetical protein